MFYEKNIKRIIFRYDSGALNYCENDNTEIKYKQKEHIRH